MKSMLRLQLEQRRGQTQIGDCYVTPPLKVMALPNPSLHSKPHESHEQNQRPQILKIMQMSASPGLMDQDEQHIELNLQPYTRTQLLTQSYQRVFAMNGHAQQHTRIHMQNHSELIHCPHPMVMHKDAALDVNNQIYLQDNNQLVFAEIICSGRKHLGESFDFRHLSSLTQIYHHHKLILKDNLQWHPQSQRLNSPLHMGLYSHQATVYIVNTNAYSQVNQPFKNASSDHFKSACIVIRHILERQSDQSIYWGLSQPHPCIMVVKILGQHAQMLYDITQQISESI